MHDLTIRTATIIDGSGDPRFKGDIAVDGNRIVSVDPAGSLAPGREDIDAGGFLVTRVRRHSYTL